MNAIETFTSYLPKVFVEYPTAACTKVWSAVSSIFSAIGDFFLSLYYSVFPKSDPNSPPKIVPDPDGPTIPKVDSKASTVISKEKTPLPSITTTPLPSPTPALWDSLTADDKEKIRSVVMEKGRSLSFSLNVSKVAREASEAKEALHQQNKTHVYGLSSFATLMYIAQEQDLRDRVLGTLRNPMWDKLKTGLTEQLKNPSDNLAAHLVRSDLAADTDEFTTAEGAVNAIILEGNGAKLLSHVLNAHK